MSISPNLAECDLMLFVNVINQLSSPQDILSVCQCNRHIYQLCQSDQMWQTAIAFRYPRQGSYQPTVVGCKQYYLQLVWSVMTPPQIEIEIDEFYTTRTWRFQGQLHRLNDLPAMIDHNGRQIWYQHGQVHRDGDRPAVIESNGVQQWYQKDRLHRDGDQPAVIYPNGRQQWYRQDQLHRDEDQPAVVDPNWRQEWYQCGRLHRDGDQPAVINHNGRQEWYQHGQLHRDGDQSAVIDHITMQLTW